MKNFMHPKVSGELGELFQALVVRVHKLRAETAELGAVGYGSEWRREQHLIAQHWVDLQRSGCHGESTAAQAQRTFVTTITQEANICCGPF